MSTGDELVAAGTSLGDHQLNDANGPMLTSLVTSPARSVEYLGRHRMTDVAWRSAFGRAATSFDLIICSGGVSGSDADHVVPAIEDAGGECRAMSLALKPGKALGRRRIGTRAVLALPGNPVAAMVGALLFARPMLEAVAGSRAVKAGSGGRSDRRPCVQPPVRAGRNLSRWRSPAHHPDGVPLRRKARTRRFGAVAASHPRRWPCVHSG